jgi:hypothetical protein
MNNGQTFTHSANKRDDAGEAWRLLAIRTHNEKAFHHPDSKEYRVLQALASKYFKLALSMEEGK